MKVSVRLQGGQDLAKRLQALPQAVSKSVQRQALTAGAEVIRAEMAELAPVGDFPPHLADNIVVGRGKKADRADETLVEVGPTAGKGGNDFFYATFVEYGTSERRTKAGRYAGRMPMKPFMRPAFDTKAPSALNRILAAFWEAIRRKSLPQSFGAGRGGTGL